MTTLAKRIIGSLVFLAVAVTIYIAAVAYNAPVNTVDIIVATSTEVIK